MAIIFSLIFILLGMAGLIIGGQSLVYGASTVAQKFRVPPVIVGLTIVALGTSAPELIVSLAAALGGKPDIAVGNIVGSNISNILIGLGAPALLMTLATRNLSVRDDVIIMVAVFAVCSLMMLNGFVGRFEGFLLVLACAAYIAYQIRKARSGPVEVEPVDARRSALAAAAILFGVIALPTAADVLVNGASDIARMLGLSEAVIGLTIVAVGTSLPEIMTGVVAAKRGAVDIAWGNVIGSNILNLLSILGLSSLITPLTVSNTIIYRDLPLMVGLALFTAFMVLAHRDITKRIGKVMLVGYAAYVLVLVFTG